MTAVTRLWSQTLRNAAIRTEERTMRFIATIVAMVLMRSVPPPTMAR